MLSGGQKFEIVYNSHLSDIEKWNLEMEYRNALLIVSNFMLSSNEQCARKVIS